MNRLEQSFVPRTPSLRQIMGNREQLLHRSDQETKHVVSIVSIVAISLLKSGQKAERNVHSKSIPTAIASGISNCSDSSEATGKEQ